MNNRINTLWKTFVSKHTASARDVIERCLVKALNAKSNAPKVAIAISLIKRAFTPITNQRKLDNGRQAWDTVTNTLFSVTAAANIYRGTKLHHDLRKQPPPDRRSSLLKEANPDMDEFANLASQVKQMFESGDADKCDPYMYFFIRQDLSPEQQLVQAAHCAYVMGQKQATRDDHRKTNFICIGVEDLSALKKVIEKLVTTGIKYDFFVEPDIGSEITAIATETIERTSIRKKFARYKLLKFIDQTKHELLTQGYTILEAV